ncbi:MAG: hypothetical protein QNJ36_01260 [Calothrix sp. MO_167.B42]|nr:hypothetical protein [Calothrix sp. MO_167.B42]
MSERKIRVTLSGDVLEDADKILAATDIKKYSRLVEILIKRYGGTLIVDYNNFYNPPWNKNIPNTSQSTPPLEQNSPTRDENVLNISPSIPKTTPVRAKKTGKELLMDFED